MPYDTPDPTDPSMLVGVVLPAEADTLREMAYVFAEEFARLGFDAARILRVFRSPFYAGAHHVFQALGEGEAAAIVEECVRVWGAHGEPGE
jgi:hypothetical protein